MGNQLAPPSKPGVEHSAELVNVVFKETLGPGRLLKSLLCLHDNGGLVVVKVFDKRKDVSSLVVYKQQLEAIRTALLGVPVPHVWPMQVWWETPNAGYMMRQHFAANLYERLSTRPFLTSLEKRWITFQLLHALSQCHAHGVCHGDIKCENVMVTSWNWVFLTDFATYKPTYLPADNPADFSYYFDTGGRRRCYLAPERFFEGSPAAINTAAPLQPDMDIFSLGCVLAELWLGEGRAFFDLGTLLAYRRGEYDPAKELAAVAPDIAELVMHMIQRAPGDRWSADHYLTSWPRQLFPAHFADVLHPFFASLLPLDPDARLAAVAAHFKHLTAAVQGPAAAAGHTAAAAAGAGVLPKLAGSSMPQAQQVVSTATAGSTAAAVAAAAAVKGAAIAGIVPGAAAAARTQLLSHVDSLLSDASIIQQRLVGVGGGGGLVPAAAEDDGICIDEPVVRQEGESDLEGLLPTQLTQHPAAAAATAVGVAGQPAVSSSSSGARGVGLAGVLSDSRRGAQEVDTEVWYEHQTREVGKQWVPYTPAGTSTSSSSSSSSRNQVRSPPGWVWAGEWVLQPTAAAGAAAAAAGDVPAGIGGLVLDSSGTDTASAEVGWSYSSVVPDSIAAGAGAGDAAAAWSDLCTDSSRWRRRLWQRQRVRTSAAAAAGAGPLQLQKQRQQGVMSNDGQLYISSRSSDGTAVSGDQGMVLLAVLLCTLLRGSKLQESKRAAIMLLTCAALGCDDDVRLQTVVPYLLTQLSDPHAAVRSLALRCVVQVMSSLSRLPPADARVYNDYLLPSLSLLPNDPEESVRVTYAQALAQLAAAAHEHLLAMQYGVGSADGQQQQQEDVRSGSGTGSSKLTAAAAEAPDVSAAAAVAAATGKGSGGGGSQQQQQQQPLVRYDAEMEAVRSAIEKVVLELVAGLKSSPDIKRGLLSHAGQLGTFFGRRATTDQLLPPLYTCLNDHVEWRLRSSFYGAIAALGPHTGHLDIFMLPYLEQALHDAQPSVSCDALRCWAAVCHHLPKRSLLKAARQVVHLLTHPSAAVRHSAVAFIAAVARALPPADVYAQLAVMMAGSLQQQPLMLTDEEHLAACLHPPGEPIMRTAAGATRTLQHSTTDTLMQLHHNQYHQLQQQHPGSGSGGVGQFSAEGRRRVTLGDPAADADAGGAKFGGGLSLRPGGLQHSMSERPGSRGGGCVPPGRLSLQGGSPRAHTPLHRLVEDFNTDGSTVLLRPSAPVYCCDLDPAALGGVGTHTAQPAAAAAPGCSSESPEPSLAGFSGGPEVNLGASGGVAGIGSRCGYRAYGFGPPQQASVAAANATSSRSISGQATQPQSGGEGDKGAGGSVVQTVRLSVPPSSTDTDASTGAVTATAGARTVPPAPNAPRPGQFWPTSSTATTAAAAAAAAAVSGGRGGSCVGARRGMLTGFNTQLAVGPGGLVIGPSAAGSGVGLRPRPKSSHTAAVESIARRQAVLQEQYSSLAEAMSGDPSSVEAADRQQMERLATTLHRLNLEPGHDVRCSAALLTYKMVAVTSRAGPSGGVGPAGQGDPSGSVYDAVSAAMTTGIGQHLPGSAGLEGAAGGAAAGSSNPSWRPRGVLASHLLEHRGAVNCLTTSNNGALLISGSDDETVKVWDIRRLERDVSFASRLTYAGQSGRITSVCPVLDGASVASASSSGSLHVWRVEYTSKPGGWAPDKYRGITAVRQLSPGEGALLHVLPWANHPALLLYSSQRGGVHCCDLRCAKDAWHVPPAPSLGLVSQVVADPSGQHWLAQGTSRGWVCLWDVRFLLCVNSWQHPQRCSIQSMAAAVAAPPRLGLAGGLPHAGVPLLYIAAGLQEVGLWDVLDGRCHQVLRVLGRDESQLSPAAPPAALHAPLPSPAARSSSASGTHSPAHPHAHGQLSGMGPAAAAGSAAGGYGDLASSGAGVEADQVAAMLDAHMAVEQINTPQARLSSISCLLPLPNGALLTGGADRCVRYWEPSWPERSYIVAGPVWPDDTGIMEHNTHKLQVPAHVYRYSRHMHAGVPVVEERCLGEGPRLMTPDCSPDLSSKLRMQDLVHSDSITQLAAVQGVSKLLVSGSRDGCIKVWK